MSIQREQFEAWAAIIKSGQMEHSEIPRLMEENLEFAEWYSKHEAIAANRMPANQGTS